MQKVNFDKQTVFFIALAVFLFIQLFIVLPHGFRRVGAVNEKIEGFEEKINLFNIDWPRKQEYLQKKEDLKKEIESQEKKIILSGQELKLVSFISENSQAYNIKINSITPLDTFVLNGKGFLFVPFRVEAEGHFHGLLGFLSFLQQEGYFFELNQLSISGYNPSRIDMILCGLKKRK